MHPNPNESVAFFTHSDIQDGRLFFHAFDFIPISITTENAHASIRERIVLELRADSVQPARFDWTIEIRSSGDFKDTRRAHSTDIRKADENPEEGINTSTPDDLTTYSGHPELDYRFPIVIIVVVVLSVVMMLICRKNKGPKEKQNVEPRVRHSIANESMLNLEGLIASPLVQPKRRHLPDLDNVARTTPGLMPINGGKDLDREMCDNRSNKSRETKSSTSELLDSTVYASLGGRTHLQTKFANRSTSQNTAYIEPIVNPCASIESSVSRRKSGLTFGTFEGKELLTPETNSIQQKRLTQLALAAVAVKKKREAKEELEAMEEDAEDAEEQLDKFQPLPEKTKLKENQYWV